MMRVLIGERASGRKLYVLGFTTEDLQLMVLGVRLDWKLEEIELTDQAVDMRCVFGETHTDLAAAIARITEGVWDDLGDLATRVDNGELTFAARRNPEAPNPLSDEDLAEFLDGVRRQLDVDTPGDAGTD
jgi:hypothetical protein